VERDIVLHDLVHVVEVGAHGRGERDDLLRFLVGAAQRRKTDGAHLDGAADVENLLNRNLVGGHAMVDDQREHFGVDLRNAGAPAVAHADQAQRRHGTIGFADDGSGDAELLAEGGLAGQRIADPEPLGADEPADIVDDPGDEARRRLVALDFSRPEVSRCHARPVC
jgi:hypothetical protein